LYILDRRLYARELRATIIIHNPCLASRHASARKQQHREHARANDRSQFST
jgi:hypothetical protein